MKRDARQFKDRRKGLMAASALFVGSLLVIGVARTMLPIGWALLVVALSCPAAVYATRFISRTWGPIGDGESSD